MKMRLIAWILMCIFKVSKYDRIDPKLEHKTIDLNINPTGPTTLTNQQSQFTTHYTITTTGKIKKN